tara:strand:+ start:199 stop:798 length:600 start_codon:yes stop_codon:yes gene_type:complete
MNRLTYIIGMPASGKSTALRNALENNICECSSKTMTQEDPVPHITYKCGLMTLGKSRDVYPGTDTLAMNIQPKVIRWLEELADEDNQFLIGEGDRLGNNKFLSRAIDLGFHVDLVYLQIPSQIAWERSEKRGSNFNKTWFKGRITKCENIIMSWADSAIQEKYPINIIQLDGTWNPKTLQDKIKSTPNFQEWHQSVKVQ